MRILIIEDSDTIRRMLEALLSARDDEVVAVGSAVEGLDNAYRFVPDVVVLDRATGEVLWRAATEKATSVVTPGGIARLRADPATRETPIVVVSSRADEESRRRALDAGVSAYYTKPFSPTALLKELDMLKVRRSSKMQAAARVSGGSSSPALSTQRSSSAPPPPGSGASLPASSETRSLPEPETHRRRT